MFLESCLKWNNVGEKSDNVREPHFHGTSGARESAAQTIENLGWILGKLAIAVGYCQLLVEERTELTVKQFLML
ncbi:MAG TPA: hypothetical protein DIW64_04850 [Cellvibrio sp.]|nr:hypothetical protein [Cellvibrio sp.]